MIVLTSLSRGSAYNTPSIPPDGRFIVLNFDNRYFNLIVTMKTTNSNNILKFLGAILCNL